MTLPEGWRVERLDERTLQVTDPCTSTPMIVCIDSVRREVRSYYNFLLNFLEPA